MSCVAQLREQFETVDGLVDDVVSTYHNGFNKAIHNYSQILQLFAQAKAQASPATCHAAPTRCRHFVAPVYSSRSARCARLPQRHWSSISCRWVLYLLN